MPPRNITTVGVTERTINTTSDNRRQDIKSSGVRADSPLQIHRVVKADHEQEPCRRTPEVLDVAGLQHTSKNTEEQPINIPVPLMSVETASINPATSTLHEILTVDAVEEDLEEDGEGVYEQQEGKVCLRNVTGNRAVDCYDNNDPNRFKRRLARARERRATLVLGIVMASFIGCWLPFFSIYPISLLVRIEIPPMFFAIFFWLGYCNSALNPIIYTIFNREFRLAFKRILFGRQSAGRF